MWIAEVFVVGESTASSRFLLKGPKIVIGRAADLDISFAEDKSISRKHAEVNVNGEVLTLVDCGSKFGTAVNDVTMQPNSTLNIASDPSVIRFGANNSHIIVRKVSFRFCFTQLEKAEKELVKNLCAKIGAVTVTKPEKATHVVAKTFSATVKNLTAIVLRLPVVSLEWLRQLDQEEAVISVEDEARFLPPLAPRVVLEDPSRSRASLFQNHVIFLLQTADEQYDFIFSHSGATVVKLGEQSEQQRAATVRSTSSGSALRTLTVFYDESRGADYPAELLQQMTQFSLQWLTARALATSILSCTAPELRAGPPSARATLTSQAETTRPTQLSQVMQTTAVTNTAGDNTAVTAVSAAPAARPAQVTAPQTLEDSSRDRGGGGGGGGNKRDEDDDFFGNSSSLPVTTAAAAVKRPRGGRNADWDDDDESASGKGGAAGAEKRRRLLPQSVSASSLRTEDVFSSKGPAVVDSEQLLQALHQPAIDVELLAAGTTATTTTTAVAPPPTPTGATTGRSTRKRSATPTTVPTAPEEVKATAGEESTPRSSKRSRTAAVAAPAPAAVLPVIPEDEEVVEAAAVMPPTAVKNTAGEEDEEDEVSVTGRGRRSTRRPASQQATPQSTRKTRGAGTTTTTTAPAAATTAAPQLLDLEFIQPTAVAVQAMRNEAPATANKAPATKAGRGAKTAATVAPAAVDADFDLRDDQAAAQPAPAVKGRAVGASRKLDSFLAPSSLAGSDSAFSKASQGGVRDSNKDWDSDWLTVEHEAGAGTVRLTRVTRAAQDLEEDQPNTTAVAVKAVKAETGGDQDDAEENYIPAVVVERNLIVRDDTRSQSTRPSTSSSSSSSSSAASSGNNIRNTKRFVKNPIRRVQETETVSVQQMTRVLPKESEREILMRMELEALALQEAEANAMFAERLVGGKTTARRR